MTRGELIKFYRKQQGLTIKELGQKIGLSPQAISQYERSVRSPSLEILIDISNILNIPLNKFSNEVTFLCPKCGYSSTNSLESFIKEYRFTNLDFNNLTTFMNYKIIRDEGEEEFVITNLTSNDTKTISYKQFEELKKDMTKFFNFEFHNL